MGAKTKIIYVIWQKVSELNSGGVISIFVATHRSTHEPKWWHVGQKLVIFFPIMD